MIIDTDPLSSIAVDVSSLASFTFPAKGFRAFANFVLVFTMWTVYPLSKHHFISPSFSLRSTVLQVSSVIAYRLTSSAVLASSSHFLDLVQSAALCPVCRHR